MRIQKETGRPYKCSLQCGATFYIKIYDVLSVDGARDLGDVLNLDVTLEQTHTYSFVVRPTNIQ